MMDHSIGMLLTGRAALSSTRTLNGTEPGPVCAVAGFTPAWPAESNTSKLGSSLKSTRFTSLSAVCPSESVKRKRKRSSEIPEVAGGVVTPREKSPVVVAISCGVAPVTSSIVV